MAEEWEYWRSGAEEEHVYAQFDDARAIYESFLAEARTRGRERRLLEAGEGKPFGGSAPD